MKETAIAAAICLLGLMFVEKGLQWMARKDKVIGVLGLFSLCGGVYLLWIFGLRMMRLTIAAVALTAVLSINGAHAGGGGGHGNWNHGGHHHGHGNWWVGPAILGGILGAAALATAPYYSYPAVPYYAPPYPPQPRWCADPYGRWYVC